MSEPAETPSRRRRRAVWALVVLAALVLLVSSLTVWVKRQALDSDAWADASASLLDDPEIRGAVAVFLVDQLYTNVDVDAELEDRLPARADRLAPLLAGALREPAERAVERFLERPRVQQLWVEANRNANRALVAVLKGEPRPNVSTEAGTVTLDLRQLLVDVGTELGFGEQLDQRLPPDAGMITVLRSDQLETAQTAANGVRALSVLLVIVVLVLWGAAIVLAPGWRRTVVARIGASLVLVGLLLLVVRRLAGNYLVEALTTGGDVRDAAGNAWLLATTLLADIGWASVAYGLAALIGAWLAGPGRYAVRVRAWAGPWVVAHAALAWTAVGAVFLLLVWWGPTASLRSPLGAVILGAIAAVGVEALLRVLRVEEGERIAADAGAVGG
jgi:hypothetical protein